MKMDTFKQVACISETNAAIFQEKVNSILATTSNPEVVFDRARPFTVYIFYSIKKDVPETALELLEMLAADGHAVCGDCPAFIRSKDKRRKWGGCRRKTGERRHCDSSACEIYYLERRREAERIAEDYDKIPYKVM